MAFASWRQISAHATSDGTWCRWSEVTIRDNAPFRGCPDGCADARPELVQADTPWADARLAGEELLEAGAC